MTPANSFRRACTQIAWLLLLAAGLTTSVASAQPPLNVHLPAPAKGAGAITALGAHLPEVAKAYGLSSQQLITLFQTQNDLGVDKDGALLYLCEGLAIAPGKASTANNAGAPASVSDALTVDSSITTLTSGGTVDAFKLHSLPGCTRVIYLDFTGHTTSGTSWNSSYTGGKDIVSAPFDQDGDPTTFSSTERAAIQNIWQRVAEDYSPFNVDVTTEDPGIEGLRKTDSSDTAYGIRVVISPTNWYSTSAGGVSYIGSFSWNSDTPNFVFTQQLANTARYIAECCSHETGHAVGLSHDGLGGTSPTEYYQGQGNWAPIMGNGYYKAVTQFCKGEYANANNTQDQLAIIATYLPVSDDHGNTLATASVLSGPNISDGGTIEARGDVDVFKFNTGAGTITLNVKSPSPAPNLDIKAELLDSNGQVLQTSSPTGTVLSASITATVAAGTYYLRIDGVGDGDPVTTGYSDYASIGDYVITGTIVSTGTKQPPVAAVSVSTLSGTAPLTVTFSGLNSSDPDGTIVSYTWAFGTGDTAAGPSASYTYSNPGTYTAALTVQDNDGLASSASVTITVTAPSNLPPVAVASANTTSGTAPLPIAFSSAGSFDPNGSITGYLWDFGDGTSSTAPSPSKTYSAAGKYTAKLTVTDSAGLSSSASVSVTVQSNPDYDVDVSSVALSKAKTKAGTAVTANVTVLDRLGRAVSGATVNLQWSGVVGGNVSAKTDATGHVVFTAQQTKKTGTETATVTNVTAPGNNLFDNTIYTAPLTQSIAVP